LNKNKGVEVEHHAFRDLLKLSLTFAAVRIPDYIVSIVKLVNDEQAKNLGRSGCGPIQALNWSN